MATSLGQSERAVCLRVAPYLAYLSYKIEDDLGLIIRLKH
jgi:hypothetical protein